MFHEAIEPVVNLFGLRGIVFIFKNLVDSISCYLGVAIYLTLNSVLCHLYLNIAMVIVSIMLFTL